MSAARPPIYKTFLNYLSRKQGYTSLAEMEGASGFGGDAEVLRISTINILSELKHYGFIVAATDFNDIAITQDGEEYLATL